MGPLVLLLALSWLMHAARDLGGENGSDTLLVLGYLVVASVLAGRIAERVGLPRAVGYVLVGLVAGPFGLGGVTEQSASSLGLISDTAIGMLALGVGCRTNVSYLRRLSPLIRAIVLSVMLSLGAIAGMLISRFSRFARRGAVAFAVVLCVAVAVLGARWHPAALIVMLSAGVWLASFAPPSARALAEQIARVQLPLALVWCALASARLA